MFTYEKVKNEKKLIITLTGLKQEEFEKLLALFGEAWEEHIKKNYIEREGRKRRYGGGRPETLEKIEDKLLFILYYTKAYPLQEILAFEFGMSQSTAHEWVHTLSKVLKEALDKGKNLPERDPQELETALNAEIESEYGIDGTERRRQRPLDEDKQAQYYSGKKKAHTIKNIVIGTIKSKKVKYLSKTVEGKQHDKKIVDEENLAFPQDISLYKDTGFQGYEPEGVKTFQPQKKPKGKELTLEQKQQNALISSIRIAIEHVIGGIKRSRIVKDIFRNTLDAFDDLVMLLACGLHNFRVDMRFQLS